MCVGLTAATSCKGANYIPGSARRYSYSPDPSFLPPLPSSRACVYVRGRVWEPD